MFGTRRIRNDAAEAARKAIWQRACVEILEKNDIHCDAGETASFVRAIEFIRSKTYDVRYPDLRAREFIPLATDVDPGAEYVTFRSYDMAGMAKIIVNYGEDLPAVKMIGGEVSVRPRDLGDKYTYSIQDIERGRFSGSQLAVRQPQAARRMIENAIDMLGMMGQTATGIPGFITNANVPVISAPGSIHGAWLNPATTSQQILDDMNAIANIVVTQSKGVHKPDTLILPMTHYAVVSVKPFSSLVTDSVLTVFLKNNPYIRNVDQSLYLNDSSNGGGISLNVNGTVSSAAGGGVGGVARAVCYARNPEYLELGIPLGFTQYAPQARSLEFDVPCRARTYGTFWHYPLSGAYADGI
jgi:hypothetical protein